MIKKLFFIVALLMPGLAYGGPSANLSVQIVPAGSVTGSILPPLPAGKTQWDYKGGDEFNGSSVDQTFWSYTHADGFANNGYICQINANATEGNGVLTLLGANPSHCIIQPWTATGPVCGGPCAGVELVAGTNPATGTCCYGPGYYEARLYNPKGYGAFWLEGVRADCQSPAAGGTEDDIYEGYGGGYHNNTHWGGYGACHQTFECPGLTGGGDTFHLFGVKWDPTDGLRYYFDGVETCHFTQASDPTSSSTGVRFTVASSNDGDDTMQVDWFRYFQAQ